MATYRARYEKGHLIPIDPAPNLNDGDEVEFTLPTQSSRESIANMLNRTRGLWADWDGIEDLIEDSRQKWDKSWQEKLSSS